MDPTEAKKRQLAEEIARLEGAGLTAKMELSWKKGKFVAASYTKLPFIE